jgi:hypothetical protein
MKKAAAVLCVVLVALVLAGPAVSQVSKGKMEPGVEMTCPEGGVAIDEFFRNFKTYTDAKILFDPNNPGRKKKVLWDGTVLVPKSKVFAWCRSVLFFHRIVLVPVGPREGNLWAALDVNAPQIQSHPEFVPAAELGAWKDRDGAYIVSVITPKHIKETSRVRNAMAQLTTRQIGRVNDVPATRSFIVADFAPVVHSMWLMIAKMDEEIAKAPPPDPKRSKLGPQPPSSPEVDKRSRLAKYEKMLEGSRTETAARYFLSLVETLRSELGEKPVVERD